MATKAGGSPMGMVQLVSTAFPSTMGEFQEALWVDVGVEPSSCVEDVGLVHVVLTASPLQRWAVPEPAKQ